MTQKEKKKNEKHKREVKWMVLSPDQTLDTHVIKNNTTIISAFLGKTLFSPFSILF